MDSYIHNVLRILMNYRFNCVGVTELSCSVVWQNRISATPPFSLRISVVFGRSKPILVVGAVWLLNELLLTEICSKILLRFKSFTFWLNCLYFPHSIRFGLFDFMLTLFLKSLIV